MSSPIEKTGSNSNDLNIYIPRIGNNHTEETIKYIFRNQAIGLVDYADFVAKKDPETKTILFYSAFIRLTEWNPDGYMYNLLIVEKDNKLHVSHNEFWIILPAKTTISRSKINTHQLVAYTDELFVKVEAIEKSVTETMTISSDYFKTLLQKSQAQANQIDQLMKIVQIQADQLLHINDVLFKNQVEETRPRALTIEDLSQDVEEVNCEQLHFHSTACEEELKAEKKIPSYCDDECFFFKPLQNHIETTSPVNKKADIISGRFSLNIDDVLESVVKGIGITKEEAKKQLEKEIANTTKAKSSRQFCGNE